MISEKQIWQIVRHRDFSLDDATVNSISKTAFSNICSDKYDFGKFKREVVTQQGKKRAIYSYDKLLTEDILCQYLKKQIDISFKIRYASRSRIMNVLFNILPAIKDMNDFVLIRVDFKSFFDSVLTEHVYDKYIKTSMMRRFDKELIEKYIAQFKFCYAGLCLSNGMTEIVCRDFDERIKARLSKYGGFFYERYVDDILIITNKYISQTNFTNMMNEEILEAFGKCPVKISSAAGKSSYIARRSLAATQKFNFLGYEFQIDYGPVTKNGKTENVIAFTYGIAEKKRRRYKGIVERAVIDYKNTGDIELLRQRLKLYSSRVVIAKKMGSSTFDWLTKGVVANYNELRFHSNELMPDTQRFLRNLYFTLLKTHGIKIPYFMKQSGREESIYNLMSTLKRNRSILFEENIGVSKKTVVGWMKRLEPTYNEKGKDYYRIVLDYLTHIKVG